MKKILMLISFYYSQAYACESNIEELQEKIEKSFTTKSFTEIKIAKDLSIEHHNNYSDKQPTTKYTFSNLSELNIWFLDRYKFSEKMLIPDEVNCTKLECKYQLPELTLHHGVYLIGSTYTEKNHCIKLQKLSIHLG